MFNPERYGWTDQQVLDFLGGVSKGTVSKEDVQKVARQLGVTASDLSAYARSKLGYNIPARDIERIYGVPQTYQSQVQPVQPSLNPSTNNSANVTLTHNNIQHTANQNTIKKLYFDPSVFGWTDQQLLDFLQTRSPGEIFQGLGIQTGLNAEDIWYWSNKKGYNLGNIDEISRKYGLPTRGGSAWRTSFTNTPIDLTSYHYSPSQQNINNTSLFSVPSNSGTLNQNNNIARTRFNPSDYGWTDQQVLDFLGGLSNGTVTREDIQRTAAQIGISAEDLAEWGRSIGYDITPEQINQIYGIPLRGNREQNQNNQNNNNQNIPSPMGIGDISNMSWGVNLNANPSQIMSSVQPQQYTPYTQLGQLASAYSKYLVENPSLAEKGDLFNYLPNAPQVNTTASNLFRIELPDIGRIDTRGVTAQTGQINFQPNIQAGNVTRYFNPENLREDIYQGMKTQIMQEREDAQKRLEETLAKTGLFRSGINLENQQRLERSALDALAKGWGQSALQVANLQADIAKTQAQLETQTNITNAEIKADLDRINAQLKTQTSLANAQNILQTKLTEYETRKQLAIEQGKLDQAKDFEQAELNLKFQLANLQANMQKYQIQADLAKTQTELDQEISKYNAEIQNAIKLHAFDKLMESHAIDQDAINKARQFNISIKNAYDELAFKWAASLLDQEIREYAAKLDLIAKAQAANAQYGTEEAKTKWNTLAYGYAQS